MASLSRKGSRPKPKPVMNVTPLVDVVLVLLIIFMVVLPTMNDQLQIELPKIANPDEQEDPLDPFLLAVNKRGDLFFEEYKLQPERLEEYLRNANASDPRRRLVVRGDRNVTYDKVRGLMAVVQNIGFPGVSLRLSKTAVDADQAKDFASSVGRGG